MTKKKTGGGARARIAAGAIALVAWAGRAIQFRATLEGAGAGSIAATLWVLLRFFTVLANLIVACVFTGVAAGSERAAGPRLLAGVTMTIGLVGVVYGLLLQGLLELSGGAALADFLLHKATPVLVALYWLVFVQKGAVRARDPWAWTIFPVAYLGYALVRGAAEGRYAYPFIDVAKLGGAQVAVNAVLIGAGFLAAGFAMRWVDGRLGRG